MRWWRVALFWAAMTLPTPLLAAVQFELGFNRVGAGAAAGRGLLTDIDLFSMWTIWACYLALLVLGRRLLGSLIITLERTHVVETREPACPEQSRGGGWVLAPRHGFLRALERFTRVHPRRALVWAVAFVAVNLAVNVAGTMADGVQTWRTDPATPGTLLHVFHRGGEQPNLAGLWHLAVASSAAGYLLLLLCRLYVVFACLSEEVARDPTVHVMPTHPDGTGGLLPIGRAALFMSLGVFVSGLGLTAIAVQGFVTGAPMNAVFLAMCGLYLLIGPMLFILPLTPLRRVMADAKQRYLLEADHLFQAAQVRHEHDLSRLEVDTNAIQGQVSLATQIEHAADMTVWPFDGRTFRRFVALLVTPILPVFKELPIVQDVLRRVLGD